MDEYTKLCSRKGVENIESKTDFPKILDADITCRYSTTGALFHLYLLSADKLGIAVTHHEAY